MSAPDNSKQGNGRPRTRPTVVVNGVTMSVKHEKRRNGLVYAYGWYTGKDGKHKKRYLGRVEDGSEF